MYGMSAIRMATDRGTRTRVREFVVDDRVHSGLQESGRFAYGGWQIERSRPSTDHSIQLVYGLHGG